MAALQGDWLKKGCKNGSKDRKRGLRCLYFCQLVPLLLGYHQEMKGLKYLRSNNDTVSWSASENAHTSLKHTQKWSQQRLDPCSDLAVAELHRDDRSYSWEGFLLIVLTCFRSSNKC